VCGEYHLLTKYYPFSFSKTKIQNPKTKTQNPKTQKQNPKTQKSKNPKT